MSFVHNFSQYQVSFKQTCRNCYCITPCRYTHMVQYNSSHVHTIVGSRLSCQIMESTMGPVMLCSHRWRRDWSDLSRALAWAKIYGGHALPTQPGPPLGLTDQIQGKVGQYIRDQLGCRSCRKEATTDIQPPEGLHSWFVFWIYFHSLFHEWI